MSRISALLGLCVVAAFAILYLLGRREDRGDPARLGGARVTAEEVPERSRGTITQGVRGPCCSR